MKKWVVRPCMVLGMVLMFLSFVSYPAWSKTARKAVGAGERGIAARVNGEAIDRDELERELASSGDETHGQVGARAVGRATLLKRLIDGRLVAQEARRMGLDQLPEIRNMVDVFSKVTLREQLMDIQLKGKEPDQADVDRLYRAATAEWRLTSLLFTKQVDAERMAGDLKEGGSFDRLAKEAVDSGRGKPGEGERYLKVKEINQAIVKVVSTMKPGEGSGVIPLPSGYVVLRLDDIRHPESAEERELARREALKEKRLKILKAYNETLVKKYAVVHKDLVDGLDFEAKEPGFERLLDDRRVLVEIKGESPITVGELGRQLKQQLYHGVERAAESKNINVKKRTVLEDMLYKRLFRKEALRLRLDRTAEYRNRIREYENSLLFGAFVQKAVAPDVRVTEEEVKKYYDKHVAEYTSPEMVRMKGIAFTKRADAESAIDRLRSGTDLQWLQANAEGQADKDNPDLLPLDGKLVTVSDLPEGLKKAVSGSAPGDLRIYAAPEGLFYALLMEDVIQARPSPFEETRGQVAKRIFDDKLKQGLEEYLVKLRAAADIKVYGREGREN
jgi:hypothetical protein